MGKMASYSQCLGSKNHLLQNHKHYNECSRRVHCYALHLLSHVLGMNVGDVKRLTTLWESLREIPYKFPQLKKGIKGQHDTYPVPIP